MSPIRSLPVLLATMVITAPIHSTVDAMDFVEAAPKQTRVLVDNDRVRIIEVTNQKGDRIPMHTHPDSVVHVIKAGRIIWTLEDGSTRQTRGKDGETLFRPAIVHAHEHLDAGKAILIELKR